MDRTTHLAHFGPLEDPIGHIVGVLPDGHDADIWLGKRDGAAQGVWIVRQIGRSFALVEAGDGRKVTRAALRRRMDEVAAPSSGRSDNENAGTDRKYSQMKINLANGGAFESEKRQ